MKTTKVCSNQRMQEKYSHKLSSYLIYKLRYKYFAQNTIITWRIKCIGIKMLTHILWFDIDNNFKTSIKRVNRIKYNYAFMAFLICKSSMQQKHNKRETKNEQKLRIYNSFSLWSSLLLRILFLIQFYVYIYVSSVCYV